MSHLSQAAQPPPKWPQTWEKQQQQKGVFTLRPETHLPRTKMSCSARPVPTALVTVQMKVVLTSRSTEWTSSWGPWTTAEAGKTPEILGGGRSGKGHSRVHGKHRPVLMTQLQGPSSSD